MHVNFLKAFIYVYMYVCNKFKVWCPRLDIWLIYKPALGRDFESNSSALSNIQPTNSDILLPFSCYIRSDRPWLTFSWYRKQTQNQWNTGSLPSPAVIPLPISFSPCTGFEGRPVSCSLQDRCLCSFATLSQNPSWQTSIQFEPRFPLLEEKLVLHHPLLHVDLLLCPCPFIFFFFGLGFHDVSPAQACWGRRG